MSPIISNVIYLTRHLNIQINMCMFLSLSELTPIIIQMELTHLGSEASILYPLKLGFLTCLLIKAMHFIDNNNTNHLIISFNLDYVII